MTTKDTCQFDRNDYKEIKKEDKDDGRMAEEN